MILKRDGFYEVYNSFGDKAVVYTTMIEEAALRQVQEIVDCKAFRGSRVRIMPDAHAGKGCVVGTTMTIGDAICPSLVGVDIGCSVGVYFMENLSKEDVDFARLDSVVRENIPSGFNIRSTPSRFSTEHLGLEELRCVKHVDLERAYLSIGTLGGGNHFIELGTFVNPDGREVVALLVHTGSRKLGHEVCSYYQNLAKEACAGIELPNRDLAYLTGRQAEDYLADMAVVARYAEFNNDAIGETIMRAMGWKADDGFISMHNYIDVEERVLRKGATSAKRGERLAIPISMGFGTLLCEGLGNEEWNCSAPHGAGRVLSRSAAKRELTMDDYRSSMEGIWTSSVSEDTLDEAPGAYKTPESILSMISDTVYVCHVVKPLYNYKAN